MKTLFVLSALLFSTFAYASGGSIEEKIERACIDAGWDAKSKVKDLKSVCACIARKHVEAASEETDKKLAKKQLAWVLENYKIRDDKKDAEHAKKNPMMSDFDMEVALSCAKH